MAQDSLLQRLAELQAKGTDESKIREMLSHEGWSQQDITGALAASRLQNSSLGQFGQLDSFRLAPQHAAGGIGHTVVRLAIIVIVILLAPAAYGLVLGVVSPILKGKPADPGQVVQQYSVVGDIPADEKNLIVSRPAAESGAARSTSQPTQSTNSNNPIQAITSTIADLVTPSASQNQNQNSNTGNTGSNPTSDTTNTSGNTPPPSGDTTGSTTNTGSTATNTPPTITPPPTTPPPPDVTGSTPPTHSGSGTGYYVDFSSGSDNNEGSSGAPWKHAPGDPNAGGKAAAAALHAGDTVYFKGGVHYYGQIKLPASGAAGTPITYDGESWGGKAIIDGSDPITSWKKCSSASDCGGNPNWANIYKTSYTPASFFQREADIRLNLTQGDQPILPAQIPQSTSKYYQVKDNYYSVAPANVTSTTIKDSHLDSLGGTALVGAWLYIWALPNDIHFSKITAYDPATQTATFSPSITPYTGYNTLYAVANANTTGVFNQEGQYVYDPSTHTLYVWPIGGVDPNGAVNASDRNYGIDINRKSHVAIRGFLFEKPTGDYTGSGAGIENRLGSTATDIDIEDNEITLTNSNDYGGISLSGVDSVTVANNYVHDLLGNMRGIQIGGTNIVVKGNTLRNISRTGIYFGAVTNGRITNNRMSDSNSSHGNGITVYQQSDKVMVDGNTVSDANIAFTCESSSNLTVTNNVFDGANNITAVFADWGGMTGANAITYNTIVGSTGHASAEINTKSGATWDIEHNILDGGNMHVVGATAANNVYIGLSWDQNAGHGWKAGPGEITSTPSQVLAAPGTRNYHTTPAFSAYGAQSSANQLLSVAPAKQPKLAAAQPASQPKRPSLFATVWNAIQSMW